MKPNPKPQVTYFQRKPRVSSYSLEFIFENLRELLRDCIEARVRVSPFFSNGLLRRTGILLDTWLHQGQVNHITGDINFAGLLLPSKRTLLTVLDCGTVETRPGLSGWLLRKLWFQWPVKRAAIVTTISDASRLDILRITKCDPAKVIVIPVAVSEVFQPVPKAVINQPPVILQVGTSPNKNLERIAQAISAIECTLTIIGELTESQLECLNDHRITYENHVQLSPQELFQQYKICDLVVFASLFEGFGMPIVEAQAVGRPVVTSNVSSMPEVAGNGACLVDPTDVDSIRQGITRILRDQEYRESLVEQGWENAKRFDAVSIASQYLELYRKVHSRC